MPRKRTATSSDMKENSSTELYEPLPDQSNTTQTASYGLRRADQRRKPSRYVEVSPAVAKKPRKKRGKPGTAAKPRRKPASRKRAPKHPATTEGQDQLTPEKEPPLPDYYFYSPPPMRLLYTEERDGCSITYFDDPEPLPGQPFNPIYRYKYPQLKKTKRVWMKKTEGLLDIDSSSTLTFKSSISSNTSLQKKRKADDSELTTPILKSEQVQAAKRQRLECSSNTICSSLTTGRSYAVANSSLNTTTSAGQAGSATFNGNDSCVAGEASTVASSSEIPGKHYAVANSPLIATHSSQASDIIRKLKTDEMPSVTFTSDVRFGNFLTPTAPVIKRQRIDFHTDSDLSFISSSSKDQSFESVSDIFDFSYGSEMNNTADSVGINMSFEDSSSRSFNSSYSHLKEFI